MLKAGVQTAAPAPEAGGTDHGVSSAPVPQYSYMLSTLINLCQSQL